MPLKVVQRCDLSLRTRYPHLRTRIFNMGKGIYCIFVENYEGDFDDFKKIFDNEIRFICAPVYITNILPTDYICEVSCIKDKDIAADLGGIPYAKWQDEFLLKSKFPNLDIIGTDCKPRDNKYFVYVRKIQNQDEKNELLKFIKSLRIGTMDIEFIENDREINSYITDEQRRKESLSSSKNNDLFGFENPVFFIQPPKYQRYSLEFDLKDECFWHENISKIYSGEITKSELIKDIETKNSCYLDYSSFENVNIRNGLLLFDKVYIELPLMKSIDDFCKEQDMTKEQLLTLCNKNKVSFILTHPTFQYDRSFLLELYNQNPVSILSRRFISALIVADLVEINKNYLLNEVPELLFAAHDFSELLSQINNQSVEFNYTQLVWPIQALRNSFDTVQFSSSERWCCFGINKTFDDKNFLTADKDKYEDFQFEMIMNEDKVHIASALNSYYFPFTDKNYSNRIITSIMSNKLDFYKNCSLENINKYGEKFKEIQEKKIIDPLSIIKVTDFLSVSEIEKFAEQFYTGQNFASLFSYFSSLTDEERLIKIKEYNKQIAINQDKSFSNKEITKTAFDFSITAATDILSLLGKLTIPCFGLIQMGATKGTKLVNQKFKLTKKMTEGLEKTLSLLDNSKYRDAKYINFLQKINHVAKFKTF